MTERGRMARRDSTVGDTAVDGLFYGIAAGVFMALYLILVGLTTGEGLGVALGRFSAGGAKATSPVTGALGHLAVSGVYGILFGIIWRVSPARWERGSLIWLAGLSYGLLLLLLAETLILPGTDSPLQEFPLAHFAIAHTIYGLSLGFLTARGKEADSSPFS